MMYLFNEKCCSALSIVRNGTITLSLPQRKGKYQWIHLSMIGSNEISIQSQLVLGTITNDRMLWKQWLPDYPCAATQRPQQHVALLLSLRQNLQLTIARTISFNMVGVLMVSKGWPEVNRGGKKGTWIQLSSEVAILNPHSKSRFVIAPQ